MSSSQKLKAKRAIRRAVAELGESKPDLYREDVDSGTAHTLTERQVYDGVVAFLLQCGIAHGSVGNDFNLYKLVQGYLLDLDKRAAMNAIVL